jgi:hypothetical protein
MDRANIGCVSTSTRDAVKAYRDRNGLANYDEAVRRLLKDAGAEDVLPAEA